MLKKKPFVFLSLLLLVMLMVGLSTGCNQPGGDEGTNETQETLTVGMPPWVNSPPQVHMVKAVIEDELGYNVDIKEADIGMIYASMAQGDLDFMTDAWWPAHENYLDEYANQIDVLDPFLDNNNLGLVVPSYVTIDSIEQLNESIDKFNGKIIGIEPGSGIMQMMEEIMPAYGLDDWKLVEGSDFAMTAAIADAVKNNEWIVVTGWDPHWKFVQWDLKYLEDPKKLFGDPDELKPVCPATRKGLADEAPEVVEFLNNWHLEIDDINSLILETAVNDVDPETAVRNWMEENPDKVQEWLK